MKKIIIGIVLGVLATLLIKSAYADFRGWTVDFGGAGPIYAARFQDGSVNCYVAIIDSRTWTPPAISCVKVK